MMLEKYKDIAIRVATISERTEVLTQIYKLFKHLDSTTTDIDCHYHGKRSLSEFVRLFNHSYGVDYTFIYYRILGNRIIPYMDYRIPTGKYEVSITEGLRLLRYRKLKLDQIYKEF